MTRGKAGGSHQRRQRAALAPASHRHAVQTGAFETPSQHPHCVASILERPMLQTKGLRHTRPNWDGAPYAARSGGHEGAQVPSFCRYRLFRHCRHCDSPVVSLDQRQEAQLAFCEQVHGRPVKLDFPLMQRNGAEHSRPKVPTPVGKVPAAHIDAVTQVDPMR